MPSRNRKVLHDSKVTNSFFNQVDSTICPCCNGRNQNHAILPMEPGSSSDLSDETAASVIAFWGEMLNNLTPEERQKWQSFIDIQETIPDPESVKQELKRALKLAYKEISDTLATADHFPPMDTFDLSNLEEAAEAYDLLCEKYQGEEELEIAQIAGRVSNLAVTASDVNCSSDDRLAAELDMQILNIHSKITVPLTACLRQAQLFNIDKKFGFVEESYQALSHDDRKRRGEDVPAELPTSFRQKLNNPSKLIESASEQSKKKNKKKFNLDDTLVKFQHNVQLMTEEFEELKKTVSDAVKPIELPSPPSSFTYAGVPVPEGIPDHIQQRFFDAAFALKEVIGLQPEAYEHRRHVQGTLSIWYKAGHEIWEIGKRQIHEMPRFREYEYTRNLLHAMYRVAARQEVKIVEFYSGEGAPKIPQAVRKSFRLGSLSAEEFDQKWEMRCLELQEKFPSVDHMLIQGEKVLEKLAERKKLDGSTR